MENSLRYISISHKTASIVQRERFHLNNEQKLECVDAIRRTFDDISGLLFLVTCNRIEVYFESTRTKALNLRDFILAQILSTKDNSIGHFFEWSDKTEESTRHLLEVSSGLESSVLGDAEIIHQIKIAYQESCKYELQGSLLERCMQSIFKGHKRISNETGFRDGTTSVAYKTLKLIQNKFELPERDSLKILFIGAGDIVKQLLNYNNKFGFKSVYVANRTAEKARELTQKYGGHTYAWDRVLDNDFEDFNVIISAVSNRPNLIRQVRKRNGETVVMDLAVPGNIEKRLSTQPHIVHYDLDSIAQVLKENHENRIKSIGQVEIIIGEELQEYLSWLKDAPLRSSLASYKIEVNHWLQHYLQRKGIQLQPEIAEVATNRIIRKSYKQDGKRIPECEMELIVEQHI